MRKLNNEDVELLIDEVTEEEIKVIAFVKKDVCIDILDEEYGALNWSAEYKDGSVNGHFKVCRLGIKADDGTWTYKESTGMVELEGNEKHYHKLVEANAFKRACKLWGIGRELNKITPIIIPIYENVGEGDGDYELINHEYKYQGKQKGSYVKRLDVSEIKGEMKCHDKLTIKNLLYHTEENKTSQIGFFRVSNGKQFVYTYNELSKLEQKEAKIEELQKNSELAKKVREREKVIEDFKLSRTFEGMDLKSDCGPLKIQKKNLGDLSDGEIIYVFNNTQSPEIKAAARNGCKARGIKVS